MRHKKHTYNELNTDLSGTEIVKMNNPFTWKRNKVKISNNGNRSIICTCGNC